MKITQKQLLMLYDVLIGSLAIVNPLGYDQETRRKLASSIINQQSNDLVDIKNE